MFFNLTLGALTTLFIVGLWQLLRCCWEPTPTKPPNPDGFDIKW